MSDDWRRSFDVFLRDMGRRPSPQHSIERLNNDAGYRADNCVWATKAQQVRNSRQNHLITFRGETMCMSDWADRVGLKRDAIKSRINQYGWSVERALTTPLRHY